MHEPPWYMASSSLASIANLLDSVPDSLCLLDGSGEVLWVNRAWREFCRANGGDLAKVCEGSNYLRMCPDDGELGFGSSLQQVLRGELSVVEMEQPCHSSTLTRWYLARAFAVEGVLPARAVVVHQSVTSHKLWELHEFQSGRLEALGLLAAGMAHDFKGLLAIIESRLAMAAAALNQDRSVEDHFAAAQGAVSHASNLIAKVMAYRAGEQVETEVIDVVLACKQALDIVRLTLPASIRLDVAIGEHALWVRGDATEIVQLVLNLCNNAVAAMAASTGVLRVQMRPVLDDATLVGNLPVEAIELRVSDTGVGFEQSKARSLFDPFYTSSAGGTGIGLSLVNRIVQGMGGNVEAFGVPGEGATFVVRLPEANAGGAVGPNLRHGDSLRPVNSGEQMIGNQSSCTWSALVVDDDEIMGMTAEAGLRRLGCDVQRTTNPFEALSVLSEQPSHFRLLLTDHQMPGMQGIELARFARFLLPELVIVVMSGTVDDALIEEAIGTAQVVCKDVLLDSLPPIVARLRQSQR